MTFEIELFEEGADVFRVAEKAIEDMEAYIDNMILNLLKQAQASLMRELGVNQSASIGMSFKSHQSIATAFEKIRDAVHEDLSDEFRTLKQRGD